jgi:hypothetical protein
MVDGAVEATGDVSATVEVGGTEVLGALLAHALSNRSARLPAANRFVLDFI